MPSIPNNATLSATSLDILNVIRANASTAYQDRIPEATQDNIREVGNAMMSYEAGQNEFLNALINRIGRVLITSKMYNNPLRAFKKGILEYGETVEEIFVQIATAQQYDPATAEKEVFKREIPDVAAAFHKLNYQNFYKTTIQQEDLRRAFLSLDGVTDLIARIVDTLYSGAEFDEFVIMKNMIAEAVQAGKFYPIHVDAPTAENAKSIVTTIKATSNSMEFMSNKYNASGVLTFTKKDKQVLIMDAQFDATVDVEVLAAAFNMDKAEFAGRRILIDNFGDLTGCVAALVDEDWFMIFDNLIQFTEQYNAQGLYWNYFYHVWKIFSNSPFANAVIFTTLPVNAQTVTVAPLNASATVGQTVQFSAVVNGTGYISQDVIWGVEGNTDPATVVNAHGVVNVGANETAETLTVTATSMFNNNVSGSGTITLA